MFQNEIAYRQRKFEKEASARAKEEKRKRDLAIRKEARIRKQQDEIEQKRAEKLLEEERLQEEERSRKEQLRELNRGTLVERVLDAAPLPEGTGVTLGIKRWVDKVRLPTSMSGELMEQEAFRNGALLFELTAANGKQTHVGVLDFSAPESTILIPSHVAGCLWDSGQCEGKVTVQYKRLLDGKFARLQPVKKGFHEAFGDNLKSVLEERLAQQSTLTEGDKIQVYLDNGEKVYELKVVELEPSHAVRILETDLEVDVIPSEELENYVKEQMASNQVPTVPTIPTKNPLQSESITDTTVPEETVLEELPEEVSETEQNIIVCLIRMPNGLTLQRRFRLDDHLSNLFHFIKVKEPEVRNSEFSLMTRFPQVEITQSQSLHQSFRDLRFEVQQVFFLKH